MRRIIKRRKAPRFRLGVSLKGHAWLEITLIGSKFSVVGDTSAAHQLLSAYSSRLPTLQPLFWWMIRIMKGCSGGLRNLLFVSTDNTEDPRRGKKANRTDIILLFSLLTKSLFLIFCLGSSPAVIILSLLSRFSFYGLRGVINPLCCIFSWNGLFWAMRPPQTALALQKTLVCVANKNWTSVAPESETSLLDGGSKNFVTCNQR